MKRRAGTLALLPSLAVVGAGLLLPGLVMLAYSFLRYVPGRITDFTLTLENYRRLFGDFFYLGVVAKTLQIGVIVTVVALLLGYPVAFYLARTTSRFKAVLIYLVFLPMMVGIVVRAYGWIVILGREGLVNTGLQSLGVVDEPIRLLFTPHAVVAALVEVLLPFMIMPILSSLEKIDRHVEEAARACGATPTHTFLRVTLPLSLPGIVSGSLLVFSLSITAYALPALLGGAKLKLIAALAYDAMLVGYNWPFGSAIGIFMGVVAGTVVYLYLRTAGRHGAAR
jgi:putative spermidine/putrescine transport system permease protein